MKYLVGPDSKLEILFGGFVLLLLACVWTGSPFLYGLLLTIALVVMVLSIWGPPDPPAE